LDQVGRGNDGLVEIGALPGAVVGRGPLGGDDPVPADGGEVDGEVVAAAGGLRTVTLAVLGGAAAAASTGSRVRGEAIGRGGVWVAEL